MELARKKPIIPTTASGQGVSAQLEQEVQGTLDALQVCRAHLQCLQSSYACQALLLDIHQEKVLEDVSGLYMPASQTSPVPMIMTRLREWTDALCVVFDEQRTRHERLVQQDAAYIRALHTERIRHLAEQEAALESDILRIQSEEELEMEGLNTALSAAQLEDKRLRALADSLSRQLSKRREENMSGTREAMHLRRGTKHAMLYQSNRQTDIIGLTQYLLS